MLSFVAFIAIINLLLGYAIGVFLTASRGRAVRIIGNAPQLTREKPSKDETLSVNQNRSAEPSSISRDGLPTRAVSDGETNDYPLFASEAFAEQLEEAVANR